MSAPAVLTRRFLDPATKGSRWVEGKEQKEVRKLRDAVSFQSNVPINVL